MIEELLQQMREEVVYSHEATMPIPLYEKIKSNLISAAKLLDEVVEWQPIESAPRKRYFQVLGYDAVIGRYTCEYAQPTGQWVYSWNRKPCQATHWQPLPACPINNKARGVL